MKTVEDIEKKFNWSSVGPVSESLYQRLRTILPAGDRTGFDTHHLRDIAGVFQLQDTLGKETQELSDVISVIASGLQAGTELKLPSDPTWIEAATLGRALIVLDVYRSPDPRHIAIAAAAGRLKDGGAELEISGTGIDTRSSAFQAITEAICERFARLGLLNVLDNLCFAARRVQVYDFDQYLFGRRYSLGEREPTIPFGFLFNLAVRVPDAAPTTKNPEKDWRESIQMARDLVAALDVEPYSQYWMMNKSPAHLNHLLIEIGLYDHLFGLRQWPIFVTPLLLENFFGTSHNTKLTAHLGWTATDAVRFSVALVQAIRTDPARVSRAGLLATGLNNTTLDHMLSSFVHPIGQVNREYTSPLAARSADLMFRPLIVGEGDTFIAPAASMVGPACYEVVAAAARAALSKAEVPIS